MLAHRANDAAGADLVAALEQGLDKWQRDLPDEIAFDETGPTPDGAQALATVEWASKRIDLPIVLIGPQDQATQAAELLAQRGVSVSVRNGISPLRADWGGN